jgi:Glycosyltransferase family 87
MWRTVGWLVLVAFSIAVWLAAFRVYGFAPGVPGSDAWNYLAAGERLNAGHPLYAISPGDRPIQLLPPYWTVPLLAPPPIAVVWRPLALLGDASMIVWAAAGLAVTLVTAGWLLARGGLVAAAIVAVMAGPLALQSLAGNANGFLFAALVLAWLFRSRPVVAGAFVAATIAVKLTPVLLLIWLAASGRWRAVGATIGALVVIGIVSLLGAGLQNHLDWLASVPRSAPVPTSIAGLTGLPSIVVEVAAVAAVVLVALTRDERLTFSAAVVAAALASPALYLGTLGIAAAAAAPWLAPAGSLTSRFRSRSMSTRPA